MAAYVVRYANGQSVEIPLAAEIDDYRVKAPVALSGAGLAWTRPYEPDGWHAAA